MLELFNQLLEWISAHTFWSGLFVFFVAFLESVAGLGLLVPGVAMMFGFGALIAIGTLEFWTVFWWAVGGAVVGDGLSFWLGRRFQHQLHGFWPFNRHPRMLQHGIDFFNRHGGKSVAFGRFFGPIRAVIPLVAGMLNMPPSHFLTANILSALVWAPVYLLPGMVFGASLEVAAEVAVHLVILLVLIALLTWLSFELTRRLYRLLQPHTSQLVQWIMGWGGRHPRFAEVINALGDPSHPEARGLGMLATGLLLGTLSFGLVTAAVLQGSVLSLPDQMVFNALQAIRNPWSDQLLLLTTRLGDIPTILAVAAFVGLVLLRTQHQEALYHWLAAVAFGLLAPPLLKYGLRVPRPYPVEGLSPWAFPSAHVLRATVTYGFLAILIARPLVVNRRWLPYSLTAVVVAGVVLSRLYLGVHWLSDTLASLLLGLAWISALGLAYYRHFPHVPHWTQLSMSALLAILLCVPLLQLVQPTEIENYQPSRPIQELTQQAWLEGDNNLPIQRHDSRGSKEHPLNVQLAGDPQPFIQHLLTQGWHAAEKLDWRNLPRLLSPHLPLSQLPVLPQVHEGRHESVTLVKDLPDEQRLVLRLWTTSFRLQPGDIHLYVGTVSSQHKTILLNLLTFASTTQDFAKPYQILKAAAGPLRITQAEEPPLRIQTFSMKTGEKL